MELAKTKAAGSTEEKKPEIMYDEGAKMMFEISQIKVDDKKFEPNAEIDKVVKEQMAELKEKMNVDIGCTGVELEARKQIIRTQETNFPSFMADIFRT